MKNKVFKNASWIIGCRIVQSLLNLVIGMVSARFLGPSNYGLINYAASIVGFAVPLMRLGLNATLVQEITCSVDNEGKILGSALGMNIISSIAGIAGIIGFVFVSEKDNVTAIIVCSLYSLSLLFQATEMITYWFQAKLLSKYPSIAMLVAYIVVSVYKIYLLVNQKSVVWFALANALDYLIISLFLIIAYAFLGTQKLSFSFEISKKLLSKSRFYIISGIAVTLIQQTDKLMLNGMEGQNAVGYYSAAITGVGIASFVYAAIIDSLRPEILKRKLVSNERYEESLACVYSLIFYVSLIQCIFTTVFAEPIILILYGEEFLPAVNVLRVAVWYVTYAYFGSIRAIWILGEEKHKSVIWLDILGVSINITLNAVLIFAWGVVGAAVASFITQFFMNFILGFIVKSLRNNNRLILKGINPKFAFANFIKVIKKL